MSQAAKRPRLALDECRVSTDSRPKNKGRYVKPDKHREEATRDHDMSDEIAELQPYADELVRLARDITQQISRGVVGPRCLSGLAALNPLIGFIQKATFNIMRSSNTPIDAEDNDTEEDNSEEDVSGESEHQTPGYL